MKPETPSKYSEVILKRDCETVILSKAEMRDESPARKTF
jgi:hypothetical protein